MPLARRRGKTIETDSFNRDIERFSRHFEGKLGLIVKKLAFELFTRVIQKTPVDTGRARGSWNIAAGKPNLKVKPPIKRKTTGISIPPPSTPSATQTTQLGRISPFAEIYITNNLPYIVPLEFGHSKKQAPNGMVTLSLIEVRAGLSRIVRELDGSRV